LTEIHEQEHERPVRQFRTLSFEVEEVAECLLVVRIPWRVARREAARAGIRLVASDGLAGPAAAAKERLRIGLDAA
jgi:hypothetical protein